MEEAAAAYFTVRLNLRMCLQELSADENTSNLNPYPGRVSKRVAPYYEARLLATLPWHSVTSEINAWSQKIALHFSRLWRCVVWQFTDDSEERSAFIFKV
jgi:hypothetical protein